jgi:hypothetical protein
MMGQATFTVELDLDGGRRGRPDRNVDAAILESRSEINTSFRW